MRLLNPSQELDIVEQGYAKLDNFLDEGELKQLLDIYSESIIGNTNGKMYTNLQDLSFEENKQLEEKIIKVCKSSIDKFFSQYKIVSTSFIIKGIGPKSDSRLHQDWSIVDESKYRSVLLWIPLVDVDEKNGCIQVVSGSHNWFHTLRSFSLTSLFLEFNYKINPFVKAVPLKKTEAAVFLLKLFHGSKQNKSNIDRPAITITIIDESADFIHYLKTDQNEIKVLNCTKEFIYRHSFKEKNIENAGNLAIIKVIENPAQYILKEKDFLNRLYQEKSSIYILHRMMLKLINFF